MSTKQQNNIWSLAYLKEYECLASECTFNCCGGWKIAIDKKSYALVEKKIKERNVDSFEILTKNYNFEQDEFYGNLHLRNRMCPLQDKDLLCSIQKEIGKEYMPQSCITFPLIYNQINGMLQKSARVSCPMIASLVLLCDEDLKLVCNDHDSDIYTNGKGIQIANTITSNSDKNELLGHFYQIQQFIIEILKNRDIRIEDRLAYLCLFIEKLVKIKVKNKAEQLNSIFFSIKQSIAGKILEKQMMKDIYFQHDFMLGNIVFEHINVINGLDYGNMLPQIFNNLQICSQIDPFEYEKAIYSHYADFSQQNAYMLENYLINCVVNEVFPFKSDNLHYEITRLVLNFAMIRFLLISIAFQKGKIEKSETVDLICFYARVFGNTELPKLKNGFRENKNLVFELLYMILNF